MENNIIFIKEEKLEKKKKTENKKEKLFFCFCYFTAPQYSGDLELRNNSWDSEETIPLWRSLRGLHTLGFHYATRSTQRVQYIANLTISILYQNIPSYNLKKNK